MSLRLTDLANMTDAERTRALATLDTQPSPAGRRIKRYELRYEMTSAAMKRRVAEGQMKETAEVAEWLFWLNAQPNHVAG